MDTACPQSPLIIKYDPLHGDAGDDFEVVMIHYAPINAIAFGMKAVPIVKIHMQDGSMVCKTTVPVFDETRWTDASVPLYLLEIKSNEVKYSWYIGAFQYDSGLQLVSEPESNAGHVSFSVHPNEMTKSWDEVELQNHRRLVQVHVTEIDGKVECTLSPFSKFDQTFPVISCIQFEEDFFITSVDIVVLLQALFQSQFTIDVKNRVRRNLEKLRPRTLSKTKQESLAFFRMIMDFDDPKPRNIEKDIKVFRWSDIIAAVEKIFSKTSKTDHGIVFI